MSLAALLAVGSVGLGHGARLQRCQHEPAGLAWGFFVCVRVCCSRQLSRVCVCGVHVKRRIVISFLVQKRVNTYQRLLENVLRIYLYYKGGIQVQ